MREELLNELMVISEEEKKYRAGQGMVERQLYARESIGEIDRELLLKRGGFPGAPAQLCGDHVCRAGEHHAHHRGEGTDTSQGGCADVEPAGASCHPQGRV